MWKPDWDNFAGVTSAVLSFGGLFWFVHYLDTIEYKASDGEIYALIIASFIAWCVLFVPLSFVGMLIENGFKRKPMSGDDRRAWKAYRDYRDEW